MTLYPCLSTRWRLEFGLPTMRSNGTNIESNVLYRNLNSGTVTFTSLRNTCFAFLESKTSAESRKSRKEKRNCWWAGSFFRPITKQLCSYWVVRCPIKEAGAWASSRICGRKIRDRLWEWERRQRDTKPRNAGFGGLLVFRSPRFSR